MISDSQISSLKDAFTESRRKLEIFRSARRDSIEQYCGQRYGNKSASKKVPVNFVELAVNIYLQRLAASCPQVNITTDFMQLKPSASYLELAVNQLLKYELDFERTLRAAVKDALFSIGIIKKGLYNTGKREIYGYMHDVAQPFADRVSLEDFVIDMSASSIEKAQFMGDRNRLTIEDILATYPNVDREKISEQAFKPDNRAENISKGTSNEDMEYKKTAEVWDIWLPKDGLVITAIEEGDDKLSTIINVVEWQGSERGMYSFLYFNSVPDNIMPLPPIDVWRELHDLANVLYRKLSKQSSRQKTILGAAAQAANDASAIINADDGDVVKITHPDGLKEFKFGGIEQETLAFAIHIKDLYSYLAGNLDMLGGLSPQSDTLGQDQLLANSASQRILDMQKATVSFATEIVQDIAAYLYYDPLVNIPITKRVADYDDIYVNTAFTADLAEADFLQYNFDIDPYSLQYQTPETRMNNLNQIFMNLIAPMMPFMSQQGIMVNFEALFKTFSKYGNLPELNDILIYTMPLMEQAMPVGEPPTKSPITKRTYERVNRPGATRHGKDDAMTRLLMGSKIQNAEASAITSPTG